MSRTPRAAARPEVWGGVECTVNRVGDRWMDQCRRSGHLRRPGDVERFAELGVRAIRYPVLWEHVAPRGLDQADWSFPDERLPRLRALGVRPIAGLVHHGSGPAGTSLVDPAFPAGLAAYARAVAERYPWVRDWTPVNEPLTTARFSGLYGHWYPHGHDDATFLRALVHELRATVLAMRAIREVVPDARLVQTDDMGRTRGTPALGVQAAFENERRWLGFDLLCGRVGTDHPLRSYLRSNGVTEEELAFFLAHPTPPGVVGLNYYVTSDRWLDERLDRYPAWSHGGNGWTRYADVHAAVADPGGIAGHRWILAQAWERYGLPVALTEVHLGGPREEQLRWLRDAWTAARELAREGVAVEAVTVWSLLGAYDWITLVREERGFYEPGPFDLRSPGGPRPTALARMTRALATEGRFSHPVLAGDGWWRRPERLLAGLPDVPRASRRARLAVGAPLLVLGSRGRLGRALARVARGRGLTLRGLPRTELDIADADAVAAALDRLEPWAVVNAAGWSDVDRAETEPDRCRRENVDGPAVLAEACARRGVRLATFSSDQVFDGAIERPYLESDRPAPLSTFGRSKLEAEARVLDRLPGALVVRTSALFGPWDGNAAAGRALAALRLGERFSAPDDLVVSPTYLPDLAEAVLDLVVDGEGGLWHLASAGACSWAELARRLAAVAGLDARHVDAVPAAALGLTAPRPLRSALGSERAALMPALDDAIQRLVMHPDAATVAGGGRAICPVCGGDGQAGVADGHCAAHQALAGAA